MARQPFSELKRGLIPYLKQGNEVTASELGYAFSGGPSKITAYLTSLVNDGVLQRRKGGGSYVYSLAQPMESAGLSGVNLVLADIEVALLEASSGGDRKRMEFAIFKRWSTSDRAGSVRKGTARLHFTGDVADAMGVEPYTIMRMSDMSDDDVMKLASFLRIR
jgi:DNA-binding transcriptional ArsR family regulator